MGSLLGITLFGHVGSPIFPWICQQGTVNGAIDSFDKAKTRKSCIFGSKSVLITWAPKTTLSLNLASRHRQTQRTYAHFGVKPWSHRNFLCILLELKPGTMKSQAEKTWTNVLRFFEHYICCWKCFVHTFPRPQEVGIRDTLGSLVLAGSSSVHLTSQGWGAHVQTNCLE